MNNKLLQKGFADYRLWVGLCLVAAFFCPWLLTRAAMFPFFDFSKTGDIGDTIGGISGTFLNFAGLLLIYYSFSEQKKINIQQEMDRNFDVLIRSMDQFRSSLESLNGDFADIYDLRKEIDSWVSEPEAIDGSFEEETRIRRITRSRYKEAPTYIDSRIRNNSFLYRLNYSTLMILLIIDKIQKSSLRKDDAELLFSELKHHYFGRLEPLYRDLRNQLNISGRAEANPYVIITQYFSVGNSNPFDKLERFFSEIEQRSA